LNGDWFIGLFTQLQQMVFGGVRMKKIKRKCGNIQLHVCACPVGLLGPVVKTNENAN